MICKAIFMCSLALVCCFLAIVGAVKIHTTEYCDVIIAGGSTAALSAGIAAARAAPALRICLTEPTDWLGGQMTSSAVSAIDFGPANVYPINQPKDFAEMMASLGGNGTNPGLCWVSYKCYEPRHLVNGWISSTLKKYPNLHIFYNTIVKNVSIADASNFPMYIYEPQQNMALTSVIGIRRIPREPRFAWNFTLSQELDDWYSPYDSKYFLKEIIEFRGPRDRPNILPVVIEATEFGDVLALSGFPYVQGVEVPSEDSLETLDQCGQEITFPFYIEFRKDIVTDDGHIPSSPYEYSLDKYEWGQIWSYRRSRGLPGPLNDAKLTEVSNQNWGSDVPGNDFPYGYFLLPVNVTMETQLNTEWGWCGGVNLTTLTNAELIAYGWYSYYKNNTNATEAPGVDNPADHMRLAREDIIGTRHGLSKVPYLRDTRRSIGLDGFRLYYAEAMAPGCTNCSNSTGFRYHDAIAIGDYLYADVHYLADSECAGKYPGYMGNAAVLPYWVPFRALTNQWFGNMLVAGKTMAQSFHANAATRLHPVEWNTGLAAGVAATIMYTTQWASSQLYNNVQVLQDEVALYAPLEWTLPRERQIRWLVLGVKPLNN